MMTSWCHINILVTCWDLIVGGQLTKWIYINKKSNLDLKKMASWDEVINGRISMGRLRSLFLALNAARSRREEEEERRPGVNPNMGKGVISRFKHWERVPGRENNNNMFMGRSRSFPVPPPVEIRRQPHTQPCCLTSGFGYMAPNSHFPQRINPLPCPTSTPPCPCQNHCPCHQPPSPQNDTESTSSESSDSGDGGSSLVAKST